MPSRAKAFDFETWMVEQVGIITKKLDNLNTTFVPREEIMLMRSENIKTIGTLADTVAGHTKLIAELQRTDERQQGAIEAKKSLSGTAIAIISVVAALIGGIGTAALVVIGLHK